MEDILELARRNGPADLTISLKQNTAELHSSKSLFRLKTYLDGAVDMLNATFESSRVVWLKVTRNKLVLEEIYV
jgi:hypothetical protein